MTKTACRAIVHPKKGEPKPCPKAGVILVGDFLFCGIHAGSEGYRIKRETEERRKRDALNARIDKWLEWRKEHPSVWDNPPKN